MYSQKLIDHFRNPRNMGEIPDADGVGKIGNPQCGDVMYLYIKVRDDTLTDVKFQALGCAAAIATSSVITEMAMGKKIEDALKITKQDVADELGKIPPIKMHCSNLAADGLKKAIEDYRRKNGTRQSRQSS